MDEFNFKNLRALVRVDFNVPLNNGEVADNTRMVAALPTIKKVLSDGGSVVLMSHLGRPKNGPEARFSLAQIVPELRRLLPEAEVDFAEDCMGAAAEAKSAALKPGQVLLLENVRFYKEETGGVAGFAAQLANHGDVYINDAFGTAHRAHASTTVVAQHFEEKMFGYLLAAEVANAQKLLEGAAHPFTAIIGGAKVSSKIEVITNLLDKIDHLIIGGGMAYTFLKARGASVGNSLVEDDFLETARQILASAETKNVKVHLPFDSVVADAFDKDANTKTERSDEISDGWMGLDVGPEARKAYDAVLKESRCILWNGPVGVFEMKAFEEGTKALAKSIAEATRAGAYTLVGGGDSVSAARQFGIADHMSYVSTGGGALLEFLEGKTLPGVAAIQE